LSAEAELSSTVSSILLKDFLFLFLFFFTKYFICVYQTVKKAWHRPPISLDFQIPMFPASGLQVRFLKVFEKSNYQTVKWVRYITKAGSYQYRL